MAVKFLATQVFPPNGTAILVGTKPNTVFTSDGKPTDRVDGIRCDCRALPDLAPVSVKVPGVSAPMSNDELNRLALEGKLTWVSFNNFEGTQWVDRKSGQLRVSGRATGINLSQSPSADLLEID